MNSAKKQRWYQYGYSTWRGQQAAKSFFVSREKSDYQWLNYYYGVGVLIPHKNVTITAIAG